MVGLWVAISTTLTYGRHNYEHSMHLETLLYLLCLCHGLIVNCGTCQVHVGPRHWLVDDTCIRRSVRRRQSSALYIKENLSEPVYRDIWQCAEGLEAEGGGKADGL